MFSFKANKCIKWLALVLFSKLQDNKWLKCTFGDTPSVCQTSNSSTEYTHKLWPKIKYARWSLEFWDGYQNFSVMYLKLNCSPLLGNPASIVFLDIEKKIAFSRSKVCHTVVSNTLNPLVNVKCNCHTINVVKINKTRTKVNSFYDRSNFEITRLLILSLLILSLLILSLLFQA